MTSVFRLGAASSRCHCSPHRDSEHLAVLRAVAGSEDAISSLPSGPKIASRASRFPALTVSTSALTASSGVANVRCVAVCAAAPLDDRKRQQRTREASARLRRMAADGLIDS